MLFKLVIIDHDYKETTVFKNINKKGGFKVIN